MIELHLGDCLEILPSLGRVDAVVADPPYGINYCTRPGPVPGKWHRRRHGGVKVRGDDRPFDPAPLLSLRVPTILWGANHYSNRLPAGGWLVWDKWHGLDEMDINRSSAELAYCSVGRTVRTFRHRWNGFLRASEPGQFLHPTQKPVALMRWCLERLRLAPGAVVFDPYMGSGPVGLACQELGLDYIGCEIDPQYFAIAEARIAAAIEAA